MTVELRILTAPEIPLSRSKLLERIEDTCERDFEPPMINRCGKGYYITATEKAVYSVDAHVTQFNQGKNQHCGDTCRWFFDGRGRMISVISDGMGSGGRAAAKGLRLWFSRSVRECAVRGPFSHVREWPP